MEVVSVIKLYGSSAISTIEDPAFCSAAMRELMISDIALEKIYTMAEIVVDLANKGYEAYCLLLGNENGLVEDILIPEQEVTSYSVDISNDSLLKVADEIDELDTGLQVLGWAHSHHTMMAFSSSTDDDNHKTILNQTNNIRQINGKKTKYMYGLTVSLEPRDNYGVVTSQFECGATLQREAIVIIEEQEEEFPLDSKKLLAKIKKELKKEIKKKVTFIIYRPPKIKWRSRVKEWWKDWQKSSDTQSISSSTDYSYEYPTIPTYFDDEPDVPWPEALKGSNIMDMVLFEPLMKERMNELCNEWFIKLGDPEIQQKLEELLEIGIFKTIDHIRETLTDLSMEERDRDIEEENIESANDSDFESANDSEIEYMGDE